MLNLQFNQLLLLSDTTKMANQFEFQKNYNLITAKDNSVGKSTLVKLLFWVFGCEPELDSTWKNLDCKILLRFSIDNHKYEIYRYKEIVCLKLNNENFTKYLKVTGEYSETLAKLLGFKAILPNRNTSVLEVPPPAYYFLPFYIDQKRSWSMAWNNFEKLEQYASWRSTIINYHVGLLTPEHFEYEQKIFTKKEEEKQISVEIDKLVTTMEVVHSFTPESFKTLNVKKLDKIVNKAKDELSELSKNQEQLLEKISYTESEKGYLEQQAIITENIIKELNADYLFTIENINDDKIECPLCGVLHDNSIINRASILTDRQQAEKQLFNLNNSLTKLSSELFKLKTDLENVRISTKSLNLKYSVKDSVNDIPLEEIIDSFAVTSIQNKINEDKNDKILRTSTLEEDRKKLEKDQKKILSEEYKISINNTFFDTLSTFVSLLDAEGINLSEIQKPSDYSKIIKEGGAAEGARGILAYYLTIYSLVEKFGNEIKAPLVIDTPNQQEQSFTNYEKIVNLLTNHMLDNTQIIMCAMDNSQLNAFKNKATIIHLDERKLLQSSMYKKVKEEFDKIIFNNESD
ncbi:MAG: hypothetical protein CVV49_12725 [Spirochaetae bacterium HGW-Spirochaetae-5]|nr:MAG: hypothetical protein CVV49_12725 [Spirochaetae bacterium HGW-Spirochaetae-5]